MDKVKVVDLNEFRRRKADPTLVKRHFCSVCEAPITDGFQNGGLFYVGLEPLSGLTFTNPFKGSLLNTGLERTNVSYMETFINDVSTMEEWGALENDYQWRLRKQLELEVDTCFYMDKTYAYGKNKEVELGFGTFKELPDFEKFPISIVASSLGRPEAFTLDVHPDEPLAIVFYIPSNRRQAFIDMVLPHLSDDAVFDYIEQ